MLPLKAYLQRTRDAALRDAPGVAFDVTTPLPASIEEVLPDGSSPWPITASLGRLLSRMISGPGRSVLEFGAGSSSLVIARTLAHEGGGRLTSVESSPEWCAQPWAEVRKLESVDAHMIVARPKAMLTRAGLIAGFRGAAGEIAARGPYDLVLVDAPQQAYGRDGALPLVIRHLRPGAHIVVDDAMRPMEQFTLFRWLRSYPSLRLRAFDPQFAGRGVAVLEFMGGRPRFDMVSFLTGTIHAAQLLRRRLTAERRRPGA